MKNIKEYIVSPELKEFFKFVPKLRIAVLASGNGSNFQNLVNLSKEDKLDIEIVKLITNNFKAGCIEKAISSNISYEVINDKDYKSRENFEEEIINLITENEIELVVMAGWMKIVSEKFIDSFKNRIINIHPSILPSYKGANAINNAFINKSLITGCSVHFVVPEVDSGELIIQAALPVKYSETINILKDKIQTLEHIILPQAISEAGQIIRSKLMDKY